MAQQFPKNTTTPRNRTFEGSFTIDAAGAVTAVKGEGFSAAYASAAGKWNVTLVDPGSTVVSVDVSFEHATGADAVPQAGPYSAKVLQIRLWDISGAALANVAGKMHFGITTSNYRT